jgi:hypothetical protein
MDRLLHIVIFVAGLIVGGGITYLAYPLIPKIK